MPGGSTAHLGEHRGGVWDRVRARDRGSVGQDGQQQGLGLQRRAGRGRGGARRDGGGGCSLPDEDARGLAGLLGAAREARDGRCAAWRGGVYAGVKHRSRAGCAGAPTVSKATRPAPTRDVGARGHKLERRGDGALLARGNVLGQALDQRQRVLVGAWGNAWRRRSGRWMAGGAPQHPAASRSRGGRHGAANAGPHARTGPPGQRRWPGGSGSRRSCPSAPPSTDTCRAAGGGREEDSTEIGRG